MRVQNYAGSRKKWQLLKVLLRLTRDLFCLFVRQLANTSTDTERRAGLSALSETRLNNVTNLHQFFAKYDIMPYNMEINRDVTSPYGKSLITASESNASTSARPFIHCVSMPISRDSADL